MDYKCPHCGEIVKVPVEYSGNSIKCTSCSEPFTCLRTPDKMTSPNASSMDSTDEKVHSQENTKETKKSSIGSRLIQNMTLNKLVIIVACVFVVSLMFQADSCFRGSGTWDEAKRKVAEDIRQREMVVQEVLHTGSIEKHLDVMIALMGNQGYKVEVTWWAEPKFEDWWKVQCWMHTDGEKNLYEWNYNVKTRKLVGVSQLAKTSMIFDR